MAEYRAPLADILFALTHHADLAALAKLPGFEEVTPELASELLSEAGRFMAEVMSPLNAPGDQQGARLVDGEVTTPDGFREAYAKFCEAGWGAVAMPAELGGGGLPYTLSVAVTEMLVSANMGFQLCPALSEGAIHAIHDHGDPQLRETFLEKLISGQWCATMDLTEPHAGSDLGSLRSSAEPQDDGSYRIRGTKIFITYGDHDLAENIIHLVLARTPDAPRGTKGISLFIVPKFLVGPDGELGERNDMKVVSIEHKLGIHASPTCVMSYGEADGAVGWLVGEENQGLRYMFTMMNRERVMVGGQGLGIAERAYQRARDYARERTQGRAIGDEPADGEMSPIVDHADVRRMLMTMRSQIEAMRALLYATAAAEDRAQVSTETGERESAGEEVALLTPVVKAWLSDLGVEVASLAVQVHGGTGYVEETGAAQHLRDARIAPIYEGTNGIQAMDLVMRKVPMRDGAIVKGYLARLRELDAELASAGDTVAGIRGRLSDAVDALARATEFVLEKLPVAPRAVAAAATPYLRLFGTVAGGYHLARAACIAARQLDERDDDAFAKAKLATASFYADQILPQSAALAEAIVAGDRNLFTISPDQL